VKEENKKTNPKSNVILEIREEFKRHTTALMEHMTKEVKTVAEGHGILVKRLDRVESKVDKIESDLSGVKSELNTISMAVMDTNQRVKSIENKIDNHETRIKKIEEKIFV